MKYNGLYLYTLELQINITALQTDIAFKEKGWETPVIMDHDTCQHTQ